MDGQNSTPNQFRTIHISVPVFEVEEAVWSAVVASGLEGVVQESHEGAAWVSLSGLWAVLAEWQNAGIDTDLDRAAEPDSLPRVVLRRIDRPA